MRLASYMNHSSDSGTPLGMFRQNAGTATECALSQRMADTNA